MAARLIYLDQNKRIELAQAIHRSNDPDLLAVVGLMRSLKHSGAARFPLSHAHYTETSKVKSESRQEHVGSLMWEISDNDTLTSPMAIIAAEVEQAIATTFNLTGDRRPFELLGKGVAHCSSVPEAKLTIKGAAGERLSASAKGFLERIGNAAVSEAALTGKSTWRVAPRARGDWSRPSRNFAQQLREFRSGLIGEDSELQKRAAYCRVTLGLRDEINAELQRRSIPVEQMNSLGVDELIAFIDSMPLSRVQAHLTMQWIRNPQLEAKDGDLNDWVYVGSAAAYCDVVVTERHLAGMLNRGLQKRATVIADLRDLPRV